MRQGVPTSPLLPHLGGWDSGSAAPQSLTLGWVVCVERGTSGADPEQQSEKKKAGGARGWGAKGEEHKGGREDLGSVKGSE